MMILHAQFAPGFFEGFTFCCGHMVLITFDLAAWELEILSPFDLCDGNLI
jgi:hypothetical protein